MALDETNINNNDCIKGITTGSFTVQSTSAPYYTFLNSLTISPDGFF